MQASINNPRDENGVLNDEINTLRSKIATFETNNSSNNKLSSCGVILETHSIMGESNHVIIFNLTELPNESTDSSSSIAREMMFLTFLLI